MNWSYCIIRATGGQVGILSPLESAPILSAQSGYEKVRLPLLEDQIQLYEVRAHLLSTKGSGESLKIARYGNYAVHAKLYLFDRRSLFIGSWNYDRRSRQINTEIGLVIDDAQLVS